MAFFRSEIGPLLTTTEIICYFFITPVATTDPASGFISSLNSDLKGRVYAGAFGGQVKFFRSEIGPLLTTTGIIFIFFHQARCNYGPS